MFQLAISSHYQAEHEENEKEDLQLQLLVEISNLQRWCYTVCIKTCKDCVLSGVIRCKVKTVCYVTDCSSFLNIIKVVSSVT